MSEGLADIGSRTAASTTTTTTDSDITTMGSSWRQLLEASSNRSRKIRGSNYVQIATVDPDGTPRCRTVVFRGFLHNVPTDHEFAADTTDDDNLPFIMKMITDNRSHKVTEIAETDGATEMIWWFPKTSEQYRIRGTLILVGTHPQHRPDDAFLQTARREQWGNLSDPAREAFYDPSVPGRPWSAASDAAKDASTCGIPTGGRDAETGKVLQPPPDHYLLMLFRPNYCDYLRLGAEQYRQIDKLGTDGKWTSQRVNP